MREFKEVELDEKEQGYGYMYCKRSDDGWDLLVGVVMYGYRVYLRRADDRTGFTMDWCGGNDAKAVNKLYSMMETYFSQEGDVRLLLMELPKMRVRPYLNDPEWLVAVLTAIKTPQLIENNIDYNGLSEGRRKSMEKFFKKNT